MLAGGPEDDRMECLVVLMVKGSDVNMSLIHSMHGHHQPVAGAGLNVITFAGQASRLMSPVG